MFVDRSDRLDGPFAEILEELANQYLIGYQSTNTKRDGAWRKVEISTSNASVRLRSRGGYYAPGRSDAQSRRQ